ncbi:MAG TPA: hypothetical protein VFX73_05135, partial [Chitinophagaceae bacterium]|nr:hypothetical protein [Chitinophagaceae bacterium]
MKIFMKQRFVFSFFIAVTMSFNVFGQEHTTDHVNQNVKHAGMRGSHRLTLGLGHTSISQGEFQGKTEWLATASWSLNYDYWLTNKWAIGLQNDIILEAFLIEDHFEEIIERSYPVSVIPVAIYKPGKHLSLIGGIGAEFASGHTLTVTRLGFEYGFHLPKNWEVGAALVWDNKWNYYNSW